MSVVAPERLVWPPINGSCAPIDTEATQLITLGIPAAKQPAWNAPTQVIHTAPFEPVPHTEQTDYRVERPGLGSLLAAEIPTILAEQRTDGSMTWGVLNGRSGDSQNWEHLDYQPSARVVMPTASPNTIMPAGVNEAEITQRTGKLAAAFIRKTRDEPAGAEAPRQADPVVIPGRVRTEQLDRQTHVVEAEVTKHRRPFLHGARLFMNKIVQLTIGGRGRHSAPGRNNY